MRARWALLVVLLWSARAGAQDAEDPREDPPPADTRKESAWAFGLGIYSFAPFLGNATFQGDGIPKTGGPRQSFVHTGRELGAVRPSLLSVETRIDYLTRHFEGGLHFFFGGHLGDGDHATDPEAGAIADSGAIHSLGGGLHGAAVFPFAQSFAFSTGADAGVRGYWVDLPGYRETTCHTKNGSHPCPETAGTVGLYVQPRLALTWNTAGASKDTKDTKAAFTLGLWAGPDLAYGVSYAFGFTLAFASPHSHLR